MHRTNTDTAGEEAAVFSPREELIFQSGSERCAAWRYRTLDRPDPPCIIMAHGFGGSRHYGLAAYAQRFQAGGYDVLVFDYRHFGDSEGNPRGLLNVRKQQEDWGAAIRFVRSLGYRQLVLWGTSFAGGHVLHTAAHQPGITAVISQVPHTRGLSSALAVPFWSTLRLSLAAVLDAALSLFGRRVYVRAFGPVGTLAAMSTPGAYDSLVKMLPEDPAGKDGLSWKRYFDRNNRVTASALLQLLFYSPGKTAGRIRCPVLIQAGRADRTTPFESARRTAEKILQCEFIAYDVGHFDVYLGDDFEVTIADQLRFLHHHLGTQFTQRNSKGNRT